MGVLLGVLLPRGEQERESYDFLPELPENSTWFGNEEIRIFRQYLTIPTVHPDIDYGELHPSVKCNYSQSKSKFLFSEPCVRFLKKQAASLDLPVSVYYPRNDRNPVVVMTWLGTDPNLKSIMLNSHTDVVPVFEDMWSHPPFAADVDDQGRIFARGSQDTKAIGMIFLAAIRAIKKDGTKQLKRTFHITFVPDEEMGGFYGMDAFVNSEEFKAMNVGFALDEARVSVTDNIIASNDERCTWRIEFVFHGVTGHGSILFQNTTGEKMTYLTNKLMDRRKEEVAKLIASNNDYTNVTTINLTVIKGGVQGNVIPPELSVVFDVRLAVNADHAEFEREVKSIKFPYYR